METTEQTTPKKSNRRVLLIGCGALLACGVFACVALGFLVMQANSQYDEAVVALASGDCATAVPLFESAVSNPFATEDDVKNPARTHIATCNQFNTLITQQDGGDVAGALIGYEDLIDSHNGSPLLPAVENQAKTTFLAQPGQLANPTTCDRLNSYIKRNWITNLDSTLPELYRACGQTYTAVGDYSGAVTVYTLFATAYPNHAAFSEVESLLAKASVAEARAAGAGEIAPPQAVGTGTGSGPAIVIIQNDSREQLSMVFSGPEARFETLELCLECEEYRGDGPEFCPELGPIGTYELPAGTYEVVVKSISDDGVIPFTGSWDLAAGEEYYSCFFLITE